MKMRFAISKFIFFILLFPLLFFQSVSFADETLNLQNKLNSFMVDNHYFEGIPELGILATASSFVKFQRVFVDPVSNKIFKVGKMGSGPDEFTSFPNVFSDGNYLYASDMGSKKIVVYDPIQDYKMVDVISTRLLPFIGARIVGKWGENWVFLALQRISRKFSKPNFSYEIKLCISKDLKNYEHLFTISDLSEDFRENSLLITNLFLRGTKIVRVNNKSYILVNKWLNKKKATADIIVYCLNNKESKEFSFSFDKDLIDKNVNSGGFFGLDFKYYYVVYGEKENSSVESVISSVDLINLRSDQRTCKINKGTVFGSFKNKMILQDIISDEINLKIVDTGKLMAMRFR